MKFRDVTIYNMKLKFLSTYSDEVFDKFDLLFITMRLLGYKIRDNLSHGAYFDCYHIEAAISENKIIRIECCLFEDKVLDIDVVMRDEVRMERHIDIVDPNECLSDVYDLLDVNLNTEKDLLKMLDELLVYI